MASSSPYAATMTCSMFASGSANPAQFELRPAMEYMGPEPLYWDVGSIVERHVGALDGFVELHEGFIEGRLFARQKVEIRDVDEVDLIVGVFGKLLIP